MSVLLPSSTLPAVVNRNSSMSKYPLFILLTTNY